MSGPKRRPTGRGRLRLVEDDDARGLENHGTGATILPPPIGLEGSGLSVQEIEGQKKNGPRLFSIIIGTPDDGCPVCKAHPGGRVTVDQLKTCACEFCVATRATFPPEFLERL